jgi:hypothetical protein
VKVKVKVKVKVMIREKAITLIHLSPEGWWDLC